MFINDKSEEETFYLGLQEGKTSNLNTLAVIFFTKLHKIKHIFIFSEALIVNCIKVHYVLDLAKCLRIKLV